MVATLAEQINAAGGVRAHESLPHPGKGRWQDHHHHLGHLSPLHARVLWKISSMETREFMEKLLAQTSLDAIDFACDLERVLAEEVKYLRRVINALAEQDTLEKDGVIRELRRRLADKDTQIVHLLEENRFLRKQLTSASS